jgi:ABC-type amino acid transport substrate-binding protein
MKTLRFVVTVALALGCSALSGGPAGAQDLQEIKAQGVLRHLGIPYANFVTGSGDGMDVEIVQMFARHLGVKYQYVETSWKSAFGDLTGRQVKQSGDDLQFLGEVPIRGDLIANGLTMLPWRQKLIEYSLPTFPTGVWLIARAEGKSVPIKASGDRSKDIQATKARLRDGSVLVMEATCLDPALYGLKNKGLDLRYYTRSTNLNEMVPAILNDDAQMTLLDVPDALIALDKWPGQIKVIGPVSDDQRMGVGFRKGSPELRGAFNTFFQKLKQDGTYTRLVEKYYPSALRYFPSFFKDDGGRAGEPGSSDKAKTALR